jgi:hypothetical protein
MKMLNALKFALRVWCQMICYDNFTVGTSSLSTLDGLCNCCCSGCLYIRVLPLL